jgi:hypothetical protein
LLHNLSSLQTRLECAILDPSLCKGRSFVAEGLGSCLDETGELVSHGVLGVGRAGLSVEGRAFDWLGLEAFYRNLGVQFLNTEIRRKH